MQQIRALTLALLFAAVPEALRADPVGDPLAAAMACFGISAAVDRLACYDGALARPVLPGDLLLSPTKKTASDTSTEGREAMRQVLSFAASPVRQGETVGITLLDRQDGRAMPEVETRAFLLGDADLNVLRERADLVLALLSRDEIGERAVLTVSCRARITELHVVWAAPFGGRRLDLRLLADGQAPQSLAMRMREDGHVLEGPRGLDSIAAIRRFVTASRLQVAVQEEGGDPRSAFFDLADLRMAIRLQAQLCSWPN